MSELPPGFELDHTEAALPPGFVLDAAGGSSAAGVAKSLGTGLVEGGIGVAALPGDLSDLGAKGIEAASNFISDKLGVERYHRPSTPSVLNNIPTAASLQKNVDDATGGLYQPQGTAENIARKIGQFAPALIGGPETLAIKALTRVVAPAVASEAGGAVGGPLGEVVGALAGGVGATAAARKFQAMAAARTAANALPTGEQLLKTGSGQFNDARDMNVLVKPDFVQNTAADLRSALKGYDPEAQKPVFSAIDRLENLGTSAPGLPPVGVEMNDVENIRKQLSNLRMSTDAPTRSAAKQALDILTGNQMNLTAADSISGDAAAYAQKMRDAVGNYGAGKRSATITGKADLAALNSGTAGSGANQDNNLRQAIKQLARPQNNTNVPIARKLGFNDPEIAAIQQAATGTMAGNIARYIGKGAPTGIVSAAGGFGVGHLAGGPIGAVALPAAGYIAKKIGDLSTKRAVAAIDSLVRSRSPLAAHVASQLPPQIVAQMPAKSQRILQTLASQKPPVGPIVQGPQVTQPPPVVTPQTAAAPARAPVIFPQQQAPIFAIPKIATPAAPPVPTIPSAPATAAEDGQRSRPSRVGLGENIRLGKYQDWTDGRIVKVGFVDGLKVHGVVPAIYNGDAPGFILTKGNNVYRVTPHRGMEKLSSADGEQALKDAKKQR